MKEPFALLVPICHEPSPAIPVMTKPSAVGRMQFDARYASGTLNVNSAADGYINTNLTANGSVGWQGKNIAASGRTDGNAGVIFDTGLENDGQISAKINGRIFPLNGKRNYLPLSPYGRYEVELQNSKTHSTVTISSAVAKVI